MEGETEKEGEREREKEGRAKVEKEKMWIRRDVEDKKLFHGWPLYTRIPVDTQGTSR